MTIAQAYCIHSPNWSGDIQARFAWNTSIKRGIKANEGRSQLKTWPHRSLSYSVDLPTRIERNAFAELMWYNFHKIFGVPWWPEGSPLTAQAASGQAVLQLDTTYRSFSQGQSVVLVSNYGSYAVGTIYLKDDTSITLLANLAATWPAGTMVYPLLQCRFSGRSSELKQLNSNFGEVNLQFREVYEADAMYIAGSHGFPTYNDFPVFNKEPNWANEPSVDIVRDVDLLESLGVSASYSHPDVSTIILSLDYMCKTRQECFAMESFFNTMAGRWGQFWVPTWCQDISINGAVVNTDTVLSVDDTNYDGTWFTNDLLGRILFFKNYDGTEAYKYVTGATATTIILDSAIGLDCSLGNLSSLVSSFLLPVRFDEDEMEMTYANDSFAEISLRMTSQDDSEMSPIP